MKRFLSWLLLLGLFVSASDAMAGAYYDEFLTNKRAGSRGLDVMPDATVRVYHPGATISTLDAGTGTTYRAWSTSTLTTGAVEINGSTVTILSIDSSTQFTGSIAVTRVSGDRVLRTADPATLYRDIGLTSAYTQPLTANVVGRVAFYVNDDSLPRFDIKAVTTAPAVTLILPDQAALDPSSQAFTTITTDALVALGKPWFDVTHPGCGAIGDGVNDDTAEIQACIDLADAAGGGIVFFPEGIYLVSNAGGASSWCLTLSNRDNVTLAGVGMSTILKLAAGQINFTRIISVGVPAATGLTTNLTIRDMKIDGNQDNQGPFSVGTEQQQGMFIANAKTVRISNVWVTETEGSGIYLYRSVTDAVGCDDCVIDGSYFSEIGPTTGGGQGVIFTGASNSKITNNHFYGTTGTAIKTEDASYCFNNEIAGNTIDACAAGITVQGDESCPVSVCPLNPFCSDGTTACTSDSNCVGIGDELCMGENLAKNIAIVGNIIRNMPTTASTTAINVIQSRGVTVSGNTIDRACGQGIKVFGDARDVTISGNVIRETQDVDGDAMVFGDHRASIIIDVTGARGSPSEVSVTGNVIAGGEVWGLAVIGTSTGTPATIRYVNVVGNIFRDNANAVTPNAQDTEVVLLRVEHLNFSNNLLVQNGSHYYIRLQETAASDESAEVFIINNQFVNSDGDADTPTQSPLFLTGTGTVVTGLVFTGNHCPELKVQITGTSFIAGTISYYGNVGGTAAAITGVSFTVGTLATTGAATIGTTLGVTGDATLSNVLSTGTETATGDRIKLGANGSAMTMKAITTTVSGFSGATATATNFIPAGSLVLGVTARITTQLNCSGSSVTIGNASDINGWGVGISALAAAGTTTTIATYDSVPGSGTMVGPIYSAAALNVIFTCTGGTFSAGAARLVLFYMDITGPTS